MLQQNQINILIGEKGSALPNYREDQKKKLEGQYLEVVSDKTYKGGTDQNPP